MMKQKRLFLITAFVSLFTLYGCPSDDKEGVGFTNNADYDIMVSVSQDEESWKSDRKSLWNIPAGESYIDYFNGDGLDIFYIVILHPDTVAKYPRETIVKDDNVLKKLEITRNELKKTNYYVTYP